MTLFGLWLRIEARRRWRSLAVLALLVAVSAGTVFTALAGARRGASAQQRLDAQTLPATAVVLLNQPGFDWAPVRALPEVEAVTTFVVDYTMSAEGVPDSALGFPAGDTNVTRTIERPVVYQGRLFDTSRADEVIVTRKWAASYLKGVGDTFVVHLATPEEIVTQTGTGPGGGFTGPRITVRVVGIVGPSSTWGGDTPADPGGMEFSPGLVARYPENVLGPPGAETVNYENGLVRLRGGEADIGRFTADVERITGRADLDVWNQPAAARIQQRHLTFEARCLAAFAVAALLAALFLVGQAIARYAAGGADELRTLRALGMPPRQAVLAAAAGPTAAGVVGGVAAVGAAVVASRWMPIGSAALLESAPGTSVDLVVLGPGLLAVVLLVTGGAMLAARFALATARRPDRGWRSTLASAAARGGLPAPVVIGTRFALEPGSGRSAVPVRPALVGAVVGVLGVIAALTFSRGVTDAADHPERFGETYHLGAFVGLNGTDFSPPDVLLSRLRAHPDVAGVDDGRTAAATEASGNGSVALWAYSPGPKAIPTVVISGRMPETATEVALGPRTLAALGAHVGDRLRLVGSRHVPTTYTVTGTALVPVGPHNGYAEGGWVTQNGFDALFRGYKFRIVLVTLRPSATGSEAVARLTAAVIRDDPGLQQVQLLPPDPIPEIAQLREVRALPLALGGFLAVLAIGAVGHALATAVRRRARDVAVLRALGMTPAQARWVVVTQASVLALIGAAFGVPLGVAAGRTVWRAVADYTPVQYVPPLTLWALALAGPAVLVVANLLAVRSARRAARLQVAAILRAE